MQSDLGPDGIPALVESAAARFGDSEAVVDVDGTTRTTFAELRDAVRAAAAAAIAAGVGKGDRVAIWAPNSRDWITAALGALTAGGVLVPMNTRYKGAEARYVLAKTRAKLLFVSGTFLGTSYVAMLRDAAGTPTADRPFADLPDLTRTVVLADTAPERCTAWPDFLAAGSAVAPGTVTARAATVTREDIGDIIFTSGTTGRPKGVMTAQGQSLRVFATWADAVGLTEGDRYLVVNPFFHTFGYKAGLLASLLTGATMITQAVFDADAALAAIQDERVTVLPGAPTVYTSLLDSGKRREYDLSSLRLAVTGAAAVPLSLVRRMGTDLGFDTVLTAYGLTESCGTTTMCRRGDPPEIVATTSGRAIDGVEVATVDAAGKPTAPGDPGEVVIRGYNVMRGYFEDPEATAEAIDADGWLRTGDVGILDTRGNLRITDRIKDMYIVGGFNAYPAEIESALAAHPSVSEAAVVGVPDRRLGEVGKAYVLLRPGTSATPEEIIAFCRRAMANYKVPRSVEIVSELPRNAMGKVLKYELRARAASSDR
ncbi:FadD3 family acyl-CoA ligase [Yinghuangia sp. ASG 101]|uniref:FadD3 family acyl-CoA ligase n=1 Tax=Yinghuangia sp. ASG 101 TaxID=2896848 RepID=UPI001E64EF8F|nr:FadD3 family acyl-CoA ligase [Yinghuangia sp. ASG 101]UGQ09289.1 FadD3 family acyl-CoA ligase [Yinghuangia sp. ASG 101]